MPRAPRPAALLLTLAACASGAASPGGAPGPVETTAFAPALAVDLAAMTRTPSGLFVRDLRVGDGRAAERGTQALVRYTGWLPDGTPVDSTRAAEPPVAFRLGAREVVRGWDEGVLGMRVGGRRQLVIPPRLGYGPRAVGAVPPNAVLVFTIDLVGVR
jgi:FKBP-type peptidyl-prolyl cis-trans isomerase FkpA